MDVLVDSQFGCGVFAVTPNEDHGRWNVSHVPTGEAIFVWCATLQEAQAKLVTFARFVGADFLDDARPRHVVDASSHPAITARRSEAIHARMVTAKMWGWTHAEMFGFWPDSDIP